jgi:hypothetical protein
MGVFEICIWVSQNHPEDKHCQYHYFPAYKKMEKENKAHRTWRGCATVQQECKYILF